jgi:hypothetical protein
MEWQDWPHVAFSEREHLPEASGIYIVVDGENFVWYVGKAIDLRNRWVGRGHHRYPQLIRSNKKLRHRLYWKQVPPAELDEKERLYIQKFQPELNGRKVKTYLPKEPAVHREIKRLLKVLNKNTLLFPVIRSVVAGEYEDDLGTRCLVVITNLNDFTILAKSSCKRYSQQVRSAWVEIETLCGLDEQEYSPLLVPAYLVGEYRIEFIAIAEIIFYLEERMAAQADDLQTVEIFGVTTKALRDLTFLDNLELENSYRSYFSDNRRSLKDIAYLRYLKADLSCLTAESQGFEL